MQQESPIEKMMFFLLAYDPAIALFLGNISIEPAHHKIQSAQTTVSKYKIFVTGSANVLLWWL